MNNYTDHDGRVWTINQTVSNLSQDMFTDLVAYKELTRALEAQVKRLEDERNVYRTLLGLP